MREFWSTDASRLEKVPGHLRDVAVLLEPLSVVVKGLESVSALESVRGRQGKSAVVLGAGSIGMLTAICLHLEGRSVLVMDRVSHASLKSQILTSLGIDYIQTEDLNDSSNLEPSVVDADVVVEAAGAPLTVIPVLLSMRPNGIILVLGTGEHELPVSVDFNAIARELVQENKTILGSVNASPDHLRKAIQILDLMVARYPDVLHRMISRFPPEEVMSALNSRCSSNIKSVISFD